MGGGLLRTEATETETRPWMGLREGKGRQERTDSSCPR